MRNDILAARKRRRSCHAEVLSFSVVITMIVELYGRRIVLLKPSIRQRAGLLDPAFSGNRKYAPKSNMR